MLTRENFKLQFLKEKNQNLISGCYAFDKSPKILNFLILSKNTSHSTQTKLHLESLERVVADRIRCFLFVWHTSTFSHFHFSCCAGVTEWKIRADALGVNRNFAIGIAAEAFDVQCNTFPGGMSATNTAGVSLAAWCGYIYNNGTSTSYCSQISIGDVVTMRVDMSARTMEYIVNGSSKGIAARDLPQGKYFCAVAFAGGEYSVTIVWYDSTYWKWVND